MSVPQRVDKNVMNIGFLRCDLGEFLGDMQRTFMGKYTIRVYKK